MDIFEIAMGLVSIALGIMCICLAVGFAVFTYRVFFKK